jgi:Rnl2 family RNA ligase
MEDSNDGFVKYQHLESLTKPECQNIFLQPEVVCTEKIHGTNARVGLVEGTVRIGGRNQDHTNDEQGDSVMGFVKWVRESALANRISVFFRGDNIIFFGEWFGSGIQKGVNYGKEKQFRVFDVRLNGKYQDWDDVVRFSNAIGLRTVPELYRGFPKLDIFDKLLDVQSTVAKELGVETENNLHEGIVIKPTKSIINENTGQWLITKYKAARWSERKSEKEKKDFVPLPNDVHTFADEFVTDTRLEHVMDHLRDQGIIVTSLDETPHVLKEMNLDILREGKTEIDKLTADGAVEWKQVSKLINNRTLTLLRQYLHKKLEQASKQS